MTLYQSTAELFIPDGKSGAMFQLDSNFK